MHYLWSRAEMLCAGVGRTFAGIQLGAAGSSYEAPCLQRLVAREHNVLPNDPEIFELNCSPQVH